jgi:hypothetical protein
MYPEDIERLFNEDSVGTPVRTVSQPVGAAWSEDGGLYVRVYPSKSQVEEIDIDRPVTPEPLAGVESLVRAEAEGYTGAIDWVAVRQAAQERTGMPILVADKSGLARLQQRRQIEARRAYDTSPAQRYAREAAQAYDRQATQAYDREPARPAYGPEPTPAYSYAPYYGDQSVRSYLPYHGPEPAQPYERYYRRESVQPF